MSHANPETTSLDREVRALLGEVRLKLHLAGMDLRDEWAKFEPQLDRVVSSASIASKEVLADLKKRLLEFRQRLGPS